MFDFRFGFRTDHALLLYAFIQLKAGKHPTQLGFNLRNTIKPSGERVTNRLQH